MIADTPTPRTDAVAATHDEGDLLELAKDLERELARAEAVIWECEEFLRGDGGYRYALVEIAAYRESKHD